MNQTMKIEPDLDFIRNVRGLGGDSLKKCYQCATCSVVCELSPEQNPFPRKEMLWAQWGLKDRLMADPDVWLCYQCADCSTHCPRGANPGDVLSAVRSAVIADYAFPRFLGKALSSRAAVPFLFLVAIAAIFLIMFFSAPDSGGWGLNAPIPEPAGAGYEGGYFGNFLSRHIIDPVFIFGSILIVICVALSLMRFWKDMKKAYGKENGPSFVSCVIEAVKEIITHSSFKNCVENKPRFLSHFLVFYGFVGLLITTSLAFLLIILGHEPPIPLLHPVKILGNISFVAILAGCLLLIVRRLGNSDGSVGKGGYTNTLFLSVLFMVVMSGGLTQAARLAEVRQLSYAFYFIHMTTVFFLLWYSPFSKFAHMFYRTLAIVFARSIGRARAGTGS